MPDWLVFLNALGTGAEPLDSMFDACEDSTFTPRHMLQDAVFH